MGDVDRIHPVSGAYFRKEGTPQVQRGDEQRGRHEHSEQPPEDTVDLHDPVDEVEVADEFLVEIHASDDGGLDIAV